MKLASSFPQPLTAVPVLSLPGWVAAQVAVEAKWDNSDNAWEDGMHWTPNGSPNGNFNLTIGNGHVSLATGATITKFTLKNPGQLNGGGALTVPEMFTMQGGGLSQGLDVFANGGMTSTARPRFAGVAGLLCAGGGHV